MSSELKFAANLYKGDGDIKKQARSIKRLGHF